MNKRRSILILTSMTGGGHVSLAEALSNLLEQEYIIEIVDPQPTFIHLHYRWVSRYALWLWAAEFRLMDTPQQALRAHKFFARIVAQELHNILKRVKPDLIITTYPFLTYEVMALLERTSSEIPFIMLFTDPNGVHASWLTERRAAATLAPTRETYLQALQVGFIPERLHQVGWPVRRQFYQAAKIDRDEFLRKLDLDPQRFTIFLQGGGEGAAQFGHTVERVLSVDRETQVIMAAGTNTALLQRFSGRERLYALPFTKEIAPYMAVADLIMGKAGPNMLFESMTLGKPFVATAYIPGQEEVNLEFIQRHRLGWVALKPEQQQALLTKLVQHREELAVMTTSVDEYRQWNTQSNERIVPIIASLL